MFTPSPDHLPPLGPFYLTVCRRTVLQYEKHNHSIGRHVKDNFKSAVLNAQWFSLRLMHLQPEQQSVKVCGLPYSTWRGRTELEVALRSRNTDGEVGSRRASSYLYAYLIVQQSSLVSLGSDEKPQVKPLNKIPR